jgi:poly(hydroxyalkanoate) depolymerase family esterase
VNNDHQAAMAEATGLTRQGRLKEATALIQRTLGTRSSSGQPAQNGSRGAGLAGLSGPLRGMRASPARAAEQADAATGPGGRFLSRSFTSAAGTLSYRLYIPTGYSGQAVPLVVMLHGGTQSAVDFAAGTGMNELAERNTFLVAYPEQARAANPMGYWNWFEPAHQHRGVGEPALLAGITREILTEFAVDGGRVYVAGLSAGGAMAAVLAATYPDLFAAAAVHSGLAFGAAHDVASAYRAMEHGAPPGTISAGNIPHIVFAGAVDQIVAAINANQLASAAVHATGAQPTPDVRRGRAGGRDFTQATYRDTSGGAVVEHWIVAGTGHAWSGGSPAGSYTDPSGPDASAEIVRFFASHRRALASSRS